jgi:hypothetical protein
LHDKSPDEFSKRTSCPTTTAALVSMAGCTRALHPAMNQRISGFLVSRVRFAGLRPPLTPGNQTTP